MPELMPGQGKLQLHMVNNYLLFCARQGHSGEQVRLGTCPRRGPILAEDSVLSYINMAHRQRG